MYNVLISCDSKFCDSGTQVPNVGDSPMEWVQLRHSSTNEADKGYTGKTFCSWKCLLSYAKEFIEAELGKLD